MVISKQNKNFLNFSSKVTKSICLFSPKLSMWIKSNLVWSFFMKVDWKGCKLTEETCKYWGNFCPSQIVSVYSSKQIDIQIV